jgi:uncharacterized protein YjiS (DUF1127 family)
MCGKSGGSAESLVDSWHRQTSERPMSTIASYSSVRSPSSARDLLVRAAAWLSRLTAAYRARRDLDRLAQFDDRMLRDVGLTRGDLRDAVAQPLWRDPSRILVTRVRERRPVRAPHRDDEGPRCAAPPLAPDDWSSGLFPARSRYY